MGDRSDAVCGDWQLLSAAQKAEKMNPSVKKIWTSACRSSLLFTAACLVLTLAFWPREHAKLAAIGVALGAALGLAGLYLICNMAGSIAGEPDKAKKRGTVHYIGRYCFYAVVLFAGAWAGIPPLAMLAGFLCTKLALVVYSLQSRKETK